ncbi:DNA polymerase [Chitinophaga sp. CC14]|uniref:DNA polymerase n=1 Tax=Chitinophaga sp. CC14 TaxID=3029199 RepID=UPI003B768B76
MDKLGIDIETYSSANLSDTGIYRYVEASDFEILLFGYSINGAPAAVIDLASGEQIPDYIMKALTDPDVLKTAHNAAFERVCIAQHFLLELPPQQWECTMARVAQLGLPLSLDGASKALKLPVEKDAVGKALIKYFCTPCKATKTNGGRTRNLPEHDPEKWSAFVGYCAKDVDVEQAIRRNISSFPMHLKEKRVWDLDQLINDGGVMIDCELVENAIKFDSAYREKLTAEAVEITELNNPNSGAQLKQWLGNAIGEEVTSLTKKTIPGLMESADSVSDAGSVKRILEIRQEMGKTSVSKYITMNDAVCADHRVRGLLQYYGANRTGRWAGRLVQVQNLPRNEMADLDLARNTVLAGDLDWMELLFGNVPDTLSQLIRTAFVAKRGHRLLPADFSAIEARVIAWLAGEKWRLDVFNTHGKIYEASAAQMFKVPIESITKGSDLRQKGKVSELALGYQGGPNALITMGALLMGLLEEELPKLVKMWRNANPAIVKYWYDVNDAAVRAMNTGQRIQLSFGTYMFLERGIFFIQLPSGRRLAYYEPLLRPNKFGGESLSYMNLEKGQWVRTDTYGGKLVENIVQAVARDVLADAMLRLNAAGYRIVMHVHDEVVLEVPDGWGSTEEVNRIMGEPISWAPGLHLKAESYETLYYKKD